MLLLRIVFADVVRAVLFDIDGTLVRTGGAGMKAFERVSETVFNRQDGVQSLQFAGATDSGLVRQFLRERDIDRTPENAARFFDAYVFWLDHFLPICAGSAVDGVRRFIGSLEALSTPPVIGLLTGNTLLGAELKLRHYGFAAQFAFGAFGCDHEDRNELAAIARERASRCVGRDLDGDEILVVGDTPADVRCAQAIGAKCLGIAVDDAQAAVLQNVGATWVVRSFDEIAIAEICPANGPVLGSACEQKRGAFRG